MTNAVVKDLAKKRREYVRKKALAILIRGSIATFAFFAVCCAFLWASGTLMVSNYVQYGLFNDAIPGLENRVSLSMVLLVASVGAGALSYLVCRDQSKQIRDLPYVPPVAEQIAALPPEEILVRGSDQPADAPGELLRAAQGGRLDLAEELLRPNESARELKVTNQ